MQHFGKSNRFGVPAPKAGALPTALHPDTGALYTTLGEKAITFLKKGAAIWQPLAFTH